MADFMFNISKGRAVEFFNRVDSNDPTNSAIILVPMSQSGTEAQGQDLATLAAVEADANFAEQTTSWTRKTLTDSDLAAIAVDNTNNRFPATLPSVTWTGPTAANNVTGLLVCYDSDTTGGTDSNIIPISHHTFAVTADGFFRMCSRIAPEESNSSHPQPLSIAISTASCTAWSSIGRP
jgi:hypothetical protein